MAGETTSNNAEKDKKEEQKSSGALTEGTVVATLSIPEIMSALHQKALAEADKVAAGKVRIVNSAIDAEGKGKKELNSAGEHIISVIPTKKEEPVEKAFAITVIKTYVQWFVGPDLASKVDDKTVKSLTESPANESADSHFMSFNEFLLEETAQEEDDSEDAPDEEDEENADDVDDEENADDVDADENAPEGEDSENPPPEEGDESKQSTAGYYISYNLVVEGLKQTALKDAMKKFAKTFFDDLTITGSGLFGGGGNSFTVKDIKDKFDSVFGPINPDELVSNIEKELKTKYPKTDPVTVDVQDKDTLISDIGKQANSKQKKMIQGSKYSLFIKVTEHDPKKPLLNPRAIADIVTSSIKGLFKKFKNNVTKDDVIYIPNYVDTHEDTAKLKRLYKEVPTVDELKGYITDKLTLDQVWKKYEEKLDNKIGKNSEFEKCERAVQCVKIWTNFKNNDNVKKQKEANSALRGTEQIKKFFEQFFDKYKKAFDETNDNQFNESKDICFTIPTDHIKKILLESMFNDINSILNEEDDYEDAAEEDEENPSSSSNASSKTANSINRKEILETLEKSFRRECKSVENAKMAIEGIQTILSKFKLYGPASEKEELTKYSSGFVIDFSKTLKESFIDMLFESDGENNFGLKSEIISCYEKIKKLDIFEGVTFGDKPVFLNFDISANAKSNNSSSDAKGDNSEENKEKSENKENSENNDSSNSNDKKLNEDFDRLFFEKENKQSNADKPTAKEYVLSNIKKISDEYQLKDLQSADDFPNDLLREIKDKSKAKNDNEIKSLFTDDEISQKIQERQKDHFEVCVIPMKIEGESIGGDIGDIGDIDNNADNDKKSVGVEDLYIVPMPNMNYRDKEYETYA